MANGTRTKILTPEQAEKLRYPLPRSLIRAAGLMRHKRRALEKHLEQVRKEWDRK